MISPIILSFVVIFVLVLFVVVAVLSALNSQKKSCVCGCLAKIPDRVLEACTQEYFNGCTTKTQKRQFFLDYFSRCETRQGSYSFVIGSYPVCATALRLAFRVSHTTFYRWLDSHRLGRRSAENMLRGLPKDFAKKLTIISFMECFIRQNGN